MIWNNAYRNSMKSKNHGYPPWVGGHIYSNKVSLHPILHHAPKNSYPAIVPENSYLASGAESSCLAIESGNSYATSWPEKLLSGKLCMENCAWKFLPEKLCPKISACKIYLEKLDKCVKVGIT
jgi:hypothetical protein